MEQALQISDDYINKHTDFEELVAVLKAGFASEDIIVPQRHHHDFPNTATGVDSTLLLMPAWQSGRDAGVKIASVNPENGQFGLPSIQAIYILINAKTGVVKATLQAKSLTAKRTAAASALASSFLSKSDSRSLLMIGTGVLSANLIRAHSTIRPIEKVYVWGRDFEKAKLICAQMKGESFSCYPVESIEDKVTTVDIISCATLSKLPLVFGKYLKEGQHIDLVGAYKKDMREADDEVILKASVFVDTPAGVHESGDIHLPLQTGILKKDEIKGDLFSLCSGKARGRTFEKEVTLFKSVGHALEDLVTASYYYDKFTNE